MALDLARMFSSADPGWRVFDPRAVSVAPVAGSVSAFAGQESA